MKTIYLVSLTLLCTFFSFAQNDAEKLKKLMEQAKQTAYKGSINDALPLFFEAEKLAVSLKDSVTLDRLYYNIGEMYKHLNKIPEAISYFEKAEKLSKSMNDMESYSFALYGIGASHAANQEFDNAIEYFQKALEIQEGIGDEKTMAVTLNGIGGVYYRNNDIDNALLFYNKALEKSKTNKDYRLEAKVLNNIGNCLGRKEEYEKALSYRMMSAVVREKNNMKISFQLLANIANNYASLGKIDSAKVYYEKAKEDAIRNNHTPNLARIHLNLGELEQELKNNEESLRFFKTSYEHAKKIDDRFTISVVTDRISEAYENLGDHKNALMYLKEHTQLKDSLAKKSANKKLEEFITKYETKQKEERIAALNKQNSLQKTIITQEKQRKKTLWIIFISIVLLITFAMWIWQRIHKKRLITKYENTCLKSVLEAEQKERKRIAQDLHDSLGQSISALKMQATALQLPEEEESKHATLLKQVDNTYDELRNISHNIMPNTLITLGLVPAVRELITDITTEDSPMIKLENKEELKNLNEDQTITLYRIIQEAMVNILKHAKASLVNIILENKNGTTSLYINDNGNGMDISKIENNAGLGWKNIFSRVAMLSGDIKVKSKRNEGTSIAIHLRN